MTQLPFRWTLARREQLGSLLEGEAEWEHPDFFAELRACCVRVIAAAADGDLVFVGRSPESIFDYLSGVLAETSWSDRLVLFNFSMRFASLEELARTNMRGLRALREQLSAVTLTPAEIASGERPKVFVDLVYRGETFGRLLDLLEHWTEEDGVDVASVRRRLRFVGITERTQNSPNTWRWYQQVSWAERLPRRSLRSVSLDRWVWRYLGDDQKKVSRSNTPVRWGAEEMMQPPRVRENLEALRLAYSIYTRASERAERSRFAAQLAAQREICEPWIRSLILEVRGG